jgi:hypothetical protein
MRTCSRLAGILVALAASTARADRPDIELTVSGSIDATALGKSIAIELGRPVTSAADRCAAPCLSVVVGDATATIVFTTASGAVRQRTVALGDDRAQWPVVVTLLAGNLVRDEAADVIGLVPDKKPPEPVATAIEEQPPQTIEAPPAPVIVAPPSSVTVAPPLRLEDDGGIGFAIGLVPLVSTDLTNVNRKHYLTFDLIVGMSGGETGFAMSGVADVVRGDVSGIQIAGVVGTTRRLSGIQVSGAAAVAGDVDGVQVAGAAAVADEVSGVQVGGAVAYANHDAQVQVAGATAVALGAAAMQLAGAVAYADTDGDVQVAGAVTHSGRDANLQVAGAVTSAARDANLQSAGAVAYAGRDSNLQIAGAVAVTGNKADLQIAGAVAVATDSDMQIAGAVNVASHVHGMQIAPINIASRNDGMQIGIINIGGGPDGDAFGLINIVPGGRYDLEAAVDTYRVGTLLLRHGGRRWHNVYGIAGHPAKEDLNNDNNDVWMYGAGFGPTFRLGGGMLDVEAMAWEVSHGWHHDDKLSLLAQGRITLGIPLGFMTVVAGAAYNTYISNDMQSPIILERRTDGGTMTSGTTVTRWPSLFVGVRI